MTRIERLLSTARPWLADGGLETSLIYHDGLDLPSFAAFVLYGSDGGRAALRRYFERYIDVAQAHGTGFVLDTATWRAGTRWGRALGYDEAAIRSINAEAIQFAEELRRQHETEATPIVINGIVGPSGDGYVVGAELPAAEAEALHRAQVGALAEAGADLITATTMNHAGEAIGIVRAAKAAGVPVAVSFTVETDGCLPSGQSLAEAIGDTMDATDGAPVYFMVNCAHPSHFADVLRGDWVRHVSGVRANASRMSHAELDAATELDAGDPEEFGQLSAAFRHVLPNLRLLGGCCGSDHRHIGCTARHIGASAHVAA
ncbi:homocysteine S-methyltransferase family protein [Rubellimicrobium roseum]|uniref:Homocysteine S-methyltransferase n=1 Tax=Rubellimicrobium roseum TaxID=687525 RepID=A0A5C4NBP2_9RHOB|nr:homocysteine S-methyltransferase family protein [Rubellimicrobium roseum]TNC71295.1 homocysteine S-methyltransferase [Rubellimicrobium roseum]